jgi:hypothetical protein
MDVNNAIATKISCLQNVIDAISVSLFHAIVPHFNQE